MKLEVYQVSVGLPLSDLNLGDDMKCLTICFEFLSWCGGEFESDMAKDGRGVHGPEKE